MRLKSLTAILAAAVMLCVPVRVSAADGYRVSANGQPVIWADAGPRLSKGRLMVPVKPYADSLGAETVWNEDNWDIYIYLYDRYVWMQIHNHNLYYGRYAVTDDGAKVLTSVESVYIDPWPDIYLGRATAPLAFLVEALGGTLLWEEDTDTAVTFGPPAEPTPRYADNRADRYEGLEAWDVTEAQGYFNIITAAEILEKYENDEPFMLACFNAARTDELREALRAAASLGLRLYGLDTDILEAEGIILPFAVGEPGAFAVYIAEGYEQVKAYESPDYEILQQAMRAYFYE